MPEAPAREPRGTRVQRGAHLRVVLILLAILAVGAVGFVVIERWSVLDALYMTIISISTVGYGEVHALSAGGNMVAWLRRSATCRTPTGAGGIP